MPGGLHRICCCSGTPGSCFTPIREAGYAIEITFVDCDTFCDCQAVPENICGSGGFKHGQLQNISLNGSYVVPWHIKRGPSIVEFRTQTLDRFAFWSTSDPPDSPATCSGKIVKDDITIRVFIKDVGSGNCGVVGVVADMHSCKAAFVYSDTTPAAYTHGTQLENKACGFYTEDLGGSASREIIDLVMLDGGHCLLSFGLMD